MKQGFRPVLLTSRISANYINPGDTLWVTLEWQNQGDAPSPREYTFLMEGIFGHQRILEDKNYDFTVKGSSMPQTTHWKPGDTAAVTLKWDVTSSWSGTFRLRIRMLDENGAPVPFRGSDDSEVFAEEIGTIDTSWNLGRPWVLAHAHPVERHWHDAAAAVPSAEPETIGISDEVTAQLAVSRPVLVSLTDTGGIRHPLVSGVPVTVLRRMKDDRVYREGEADCTVVWQLLKQSASRAVYGASVCADGAERASFRLNWEAAGRVLRVWISDRTEADGYELLELRYNAFAELDAGYLLDFWGAGRLIPIEDATPAFFEKKYDVRNAAALYDDHSMILVESLHIDSLLTTGISKTGSADCGINRGFIGGSIVSRVRAGRGIPSIPVKEPPVFTIEVIHSDTKPDWQDAARLWRRGLQRNPAFEQYRNVYFYKQLATWGPLPDEAMRREDPYPTTQNLFRTVTFRQITENAKGFSHLTDGGKQVLYIAGWQKGGFDNAYPEPFDAEERCGGLEGLRDCLRELREYNIDAGLHDNFDDVCSDLVGTFPDTAIDENGEKWRGWIWPAGMTYINGTRKYVDSGRAEERIGRMCGLLPLRDTYHIDVLSAEVCRYDYDPAHPASAQDSLDAKLEIIEAFRRRGLDVTSEVLTHPFVGKIGFTLHNRIDTDAVFIPGDRFVPLVEMIYHGTIGYCAPGRSVKQLLWGILLGGQTFYEEDITGPLCVSRYYLQNIPAMLLYGRKMESFEMNGDRAAAFYENGAYVEADFGAETYTAVIDGMIVGKDFTTFTRGRLAGTWLAYSLNGGELRRPLPDGMSAAPRAVLLTVNGEEGSVPCRIEEGELIIDMPAAAPVKIYG